MTFVEKENYSWDWPDEARSTTTSLTDGDKRRLFAFPEKSVLLCFFLSLSHKLCTQLLDGWSHFFLDNSISENFQTYTTLSSPSNLFELHAMRALIYNPYYATYFWRHIDIWRLECHDFRLIYVNFRIWKDIIAFKELPQEKCLKPGWNPEWVFFFPCFLSLFFDAFFPDYFKIFRCSVLHHLIGFFFQPSILNMFLFRFLFWNFLK